MSEMDVMIEESQAESQIPTEQFGEAMVPEAENAVLAITDASRMRAMVSWLEQISKHLTHIEMRAMESEVLGHEVVRVFMQLLEEFVPSPYGDWGYLLRKCQDLAVRTLRQLTRCWHRAPEKVEDFAMRATRLVRLYLEEALHRVLLGEANPMRKAAYCTVCMTLNKLEGGEGLWKTFTEANVMRLAEQLQAGEDTSIENLPSFEEVKKHGDLMVEVVSLKPVKIVPESILMSQAEIKSLIEYVRQIRVPEHVELPGSEGPSKLQGIFERQ